jgi:hypothetical protein
MKQPIEPELMWSRSTSAVYGWLVGIAVSAVRQVHFVVSNDVPNDAYMRVVGELAAGAFGGAILFAMIASLRNHLRRRAAATATASMTPTLREFP